MQINNNTHHLNIIITKLKTKTHTQKSDEIQNAQTPFKWATFTYAGKQTKHITKLFKNTNPKNCLKDKQCSGTSIHPKTLQTP